MNPLARGLLVVAAITLVVVVLQLYATLAALYLIASIAFFIAIAFFVFLMWRERRGDRDVVDARPGRLLRRRHPRRRCARRVLHCRRSGPDALAFLLILIACGFSMFRVWRDQHSY